MVVALVVIDHLHRAGGHDVQLAAGELRALAEQPGPAALREAHGRAVDGGTGLDIGPAQIAQFFLLGKLDRVVRGDGPAGQVLEHVRQQGIVVELVGELGKAKMELAPRDRLVDLGEAVDQRSELAVEPIEIAVDRVQFLPELCPEVENMVVLAGPDIEAPRDFSLGLPIGPGGRKQGVLGVRHVVLRDAAAMIAADRRAASIAGLPVL